MKDFLDLNKNEYTVYPNLWDTTETVVRGTL